MKTVESTQLPSSSSRCVDSTVFIDEDCRVEGIDEDCRVYTTTFTMKAVEST